MAAGGLLLTYNAAAPVLAALVSNVRVRSGVSTEQKRIKAQLSAAHVSADSDAMDVEGKMDADAALLGAMASLSALVASQRLVRLAGTQRLDLSSTSHSSHSADSDSSHSLEPLLVETAPSKSPLPLLGRVRMGVGAAYHLLPFASDECVAARSVEQSKALLARVEKNAALSEETRRMWRTAWQCQMEGALYEAVAALPFVELVWALLHRHYAQHRLL